MNKKVKEKLPATFEEALNLLEDSVSKLESGELTLEESLQVFERGIAASRACTGLLDQTRKRVQVLVEKEGVERLYLVVETKGTLSPDMLRDKEAAKVECGKIHFKEIGQASDAASYVVARTWDDVMSVIL